MFPSIVVLYGLVFILLFFMNRCVVCFTPDIIGCTTSRKFYRDHEHVFWQMSDEPLSYFCLKVA